MRIDKFIFGAILVIIGLFIDRIIYHLVYLPRIGKAFALYVSTTEIMQFYKLPVSWIGLVFIVTGVFFLLIGRTKK